MNITDETLEIWMLRFLDKFEALEKKIDRLSSIQECLDGDKLLDNQDLCLLFKVCHRTLQRYRSSGKLPYYRIDGRVYYKASEVNDFIKDHLALKVPYSQLQKKISKDVNLHIVNRFE